MDIIKSLIAERENTVEKVRSVRVGDIVFLETYFDNNPDENGPLVIKISPFKDDKGDFLRVSPDTMIARALLGKFKDDEVRIECEDSYTVFITDIDNGE